MIRDRAVLALLVAETVSSIGSQLSALAIPWFVLVTTGSATKMGLVLAAELIPIAVLGIPSGAVIQRLGPRRTMLLSDFVRAPLIALIPLLTIFGVLSFEALLVIAALHGLFSMTYFTCQRIILPEVVGENERLLGQANSLIEAASNIAGFLGPMLAGLLIVALGPTSVLWLDAASFAFSFAVIRLFVRVKLRVVTPSEERPGIWAGLAHLTRDRLIGRATISNLLYGFLLRVLFASLPVLAFEEYDRSPVVAGFLSAAWGAGAIGGSIVAYPLIGRLPPLRLASFASVGISLPLWLLVPDLPLPFAGAALFLSAGAIPIGNAPYLAVLSTRVPAALRGKVLQSILTVNSLLGPLGFAVAGPLFEHVGLHPAYLLVAGLATIAAINFVLAVRGGDQRGSPQPR